MERFRIEVGYDHDVKPGNIVGAIANEAGLDGDHVGQIEISEQFSLIDLPKGMPKEIFRDLKKVWVCGQQLKISRLNEGGKTDKRIDRGTSAGAKARPKSAGNADHKAGGAKKTNKKKVRGKPGGGTRGGKKKFAQK